MRILLGLSGGLDSAFAAKLLSEGHEVEGAVLLMHGYTDTEAAQTAAKEAGIPLHVLDRRNIFHREVESYFVSEYRQGRTPNPCAVCNPRVKIGELCRFAAENSFDRVATGHYAKIKNENGRYFIAMGDDPRKDQSYMLWGLTQEQLRMLYLPLGEMTKSHVREKATEWGLSSADSRESQDICFIPDGNYAEFVTHHSAPMEEGNFVSAEGKVLGRHKGILHYTVGQRRGLGVSTGERMFVSNINPETNEILLLPDGGSEIKEITVDGLNFQKISPVDIGENSEIDLTCKIRYAAKPADVSVKITDGVARVTFRQPVRSVAPGQSAVFYSDDGIAFGGFICK